MLAADGSLAPAGVVGELWIGGEAVSDGYIGRDDDTAAAFRPDPFAETGRIYRTGDRAHFDADGTLGFHGRRDRQVKLRGFRLDLRHIERVLERVPTVGRALAQVVDAGTPTARLVAWVTGAEGRAPPDPTVLRRTIEPHLPAHMLPALVPTLQFPRTPGGKIDLAALPPPAQTPPAPTGANTDDTAQADSTTLAIAALMARTLNLGSVAPDDRFHDLGGHSLLAVQLIGRIEETLGHRLGAGDLHRNPTPRALAAAVNAVRTGPRFILPIQPMGNNPPLFGVHVLGRNEQHFRPLAAELGPDHPVFGLTVGPPAPETPVGVEATARCYFEDIQRYHPDGPLSFAAVSLASYFAFDLVQQLVAAGREVTMLTLFDAEGPGGRARLHGAARLRTHLAQMRSRGLSYVRDHAAHRIVTLRTRLGSLTYPDARPGAHSVQGPSAADEPSAVIGAFIEANVRAVGAYEAKPLTVPITIFRAGADIFDSPDSTRDGLGWASVASAGFRVIDVPGDHLSILQQPNVAVLAGHMARVMRKG